MSLKLKSGLYIVRNKDTKEAIGIRWVFDSENEAGRQLTDYRSKEELGEGYFLNLCEMIKEENAADEREKYHCPTSLDCLENEGEAFADYRTPEYYLNLEEELKELSRQRNKYNQFFNILTETQARRLSYKTDDPSISLREIARLEGTSLSKIQKTFAQIKKKYLEFANQ